MFHTGKVGVYDIVWYAMISCGMVVECVQLATFQTDTGDGDDGGFVFVLPSSILHLG